jgi:D-alanine-D-alanine ligase
MVAILKNFNNRSHNRKVAVVMGDPNKTEAVIPLEDYDPIDEYGMRQLYNAMNALKNYSFTVVNNHDKLIVNLMKLRSKIDYVFNLCDEGFENDAAKEYYIPALLEILKIPYTGAGPLCLGLCYDKSLVRGVAKELGIPVANAILVCPGDESFEISFDFPVFVKPNFGDSSYGITSNNVVHNYSQLDKVITDLRTIFSLDLPILIEEFLTGPDLSVGLVGNMNTGFSFSAISEEDYSKLPKELPQICGYEAKWLYNSPYNVVKSIPARIPENTAKFLLNSSIKLFHRLGCRDYCRIDWRLDSQQNPRMLEVNPNAGICWDGHLTKMASFYGISFSGLLEMILRASEERLFTNMNNNYLQSQNNIDSSIWV